MWCDLEKLVLSVDVVLGAGLGLYSWIEEYEE